MEFMEEALDKITQMVVVLLALGVAGFIVTVAAVALFGQQIALLMQKLPF